MQKGKTWSQLVLQLPHYSPNLFHSNKVKARCTTAWVVNGAEEEKELYRLHQQTEDTRKRNQPRNWHCSYAQFDLEISLEFFCFPYRGYMSFSKKAWFRTPFALLYCPSSHNQTKLTSVISLLWKHWKLLPTSPQKPEVWLQFNLNATKNGTTMAREQSRCC